MQPIIQLLTFIFTTIVSSVNQVFSNSQRPTVTRTITAQEVQAFDGQSGSWATVFPNSLWTNKDGKYQVLILSAGNFTFNSIKVGDGSIANATVTGGTLTAVSIVETSAVTGAAIQAAKDFAILSGKQYTDNQTAITLNAANANTTLVAGQTRTAYEIFANNAASNAEIAANAYTDSKLIAERQLASLGIKDRRRVELTQGTTPAFLPIITGMLEGTVVVEIGVNDTNGLVFDTPMQLQVVDSTGNQIIVEASTDDALIFERSKTGVMTFIRKLDNRLMEAFQKLKLELDKKVDKIELAAALQTQLDYIIANLVFAGAPTPPNQ